MGLVPELRSAMSEELLSALLDGECSPGDVKRLMDELASSPALKQRWKEPGCRPFRAISAPE